MLGTKPEVIASVEDRELFARLMDKLNIKMPEADTVSDIANVESVAAKIGYPVIIRPSYVLGGRGMANSGVLRLKDARLLPSINNVAILAIGMPDTFETIGTVLDALGFASSTYITLFSTANCTLIKPITPSSTAIFSI